MQAAEDPTQGKGTQTARGTELLQEKTNGTHRHLHRTRQRTSGWLRMDVSQSRELSTQSDAKSKVNNALLMSNRGKEPHYLL